QGYVHFIHVFVLTVFVVGASLEASCQECIENPQTAAGCSFLAPRRFEWNFRRNLCEYSAKYWHEEKTWTATRYYYWDWAYRETPTRYS
ncbi:hypothetical protein, partial [Thiolapillus sp.]